MADVATEFESPSKSSNLSRVGDVDTSRTGSTNTKRSLAACWQASSLHLGQYLSSTKWLSAFSFVAVKNFVVVNFRSNVILPNLVKDPGIKVLLGQSVLVSTIEL